MNTDELKKFIGTTVPFKIGDTIIGIAKITRIDENGDVIAEIKL